MYEKILTLRIDEVLHYLWDPIGVSDAPSARDEYETYVPIIVGSVLSKKNTSAIAAILTEISTKQIGLTAHEDHDKEIAEIILDWNEYLREEYGINDKT